MPSIRMDEIWDAFHQLVGFKKHPKVEKVMPNYKIYKLAKLFQDSKPISQRLGYIAYIQ